MININPSTCLKSDCHGFIFFTRKKEEKANFLILDNLSQFFDNVKTLKEKNECGEMAFRVIVVCNFNEIFM